MANSVPNETMKRTKTVSFSGEAFDGQGTQTGSKKMKPLTEEHSKDGRMKEQVEQPLKIEDYLQKFSDSLEELQKVRSKTLEGKGSWVGPHRAGIR